MAGLRPRFEKGPLTFHATTVANGGNMRAGVMVAPHATDTTKIAVAAADSTRCLGLAIGDTTGSDFANAETTDPWGNPVVNAHHPPNEVAVAYQGVWDIQAVGRIEFGDLVAVGANGFVKTLGVGAANTVVGRCVQKEGINDGAKGMILLGGVGA